MYRRFFTERDISDYPLTATDLSRSPAEIYALTTTRAEEIDRLFKTIRLGDFHAFRYFSRKMLDIKGVDQKTLRDRLGLAKILSRLRDGDGLSPLHAAAKSGNRDICSYILDQKVDVDLKISTENNQGVTPLHFASQYGDSDIVDLLLKKGAKVQATRNDGFTPLHGAVAAGKKENVRLLLSRGADANTNGSPLVEAMVNERYEIVEILLNYGANPNYCPYDGFTPLIWCICKNDARSLSLLLEWELREHKYCKELATILGMKAFHAKNYGIALYYYSVAIAEDPDDYQLVSSRSICWSRLQNGVAALHDAETLTQRFPELAKGYRRVGDALYTMRDYAKAANAYAEALRLDPDHQEKNLQNQYEKAKARQNCNKR